MGNAVEGRQGYKMARLRSLLTSFELWAEKIDDIGKRWYTEETDLAVFEGEFEDRHMGVGDRLKIVPYLP